MMERNEDKLSFMEQIRMQYSLIKKKPIKNKQDIFMKKCNMNKSLQNLEEKRTKLKGK